MKLKVARESSGLSLRALARKTGFSASFLSQAELGQVSPSLGSLDKIAHALGVSLPELLSEPARDSDPVLRRRARRVLESEWSHATAESLLPAGAHALVSALLVRIEPGGRSGKSSLPYQGKGFAYCVRGKVELLLGEERHALGPGDSALYDARVPALWENRGRQAAEVLLVHLRGV